MCVCVCVCVCVRFGIKYDRIRKKEILYKESNCHIWSYESRHRNELFHKKPNFNGISFT